MPRSKAVDFRLSPKRDIVAAKAVFHKAFKNKACRAGSPSTDTKSRIGPFVSLGPKIES
jgi:transposase-like protein